MINTVIIGFFYSESSLIHTASCARIVSRESPSCVKTVARTESSSLLQDFEMAHAREETKVTNSQEVIISPLP